jgi:hypothetical protein
MIFYRYISPLRGFENASPVLSGTAVSSSCNATVEAGKALTVCQILMGGGGIYIIINHLKGI